MSNHKKVYDENDGIHLTRIIQTTECHTHKARFGDACWNLGTNLGFMRAICDRRARSAGCNGDISQDPKHGNAPVKTA